MILCDLFLEFMLIGALSFGGGYGVLAMIEDAAVTSRGWLTAAQFHDLVAFAEITPGPISLNAASFAGFTAAGIPGAAAATVGCVLPALCTVSLLALLYGKYASHPLFSGILSSVRPVVCALIFSAFAGVFLSAVFGPDAAGAARPPIRLAAFLLFGASFALARSRRVPPAAVILLSGLCGMIVL